METRSLPDNPGDLAFLGFHYKINGKYVYDGLCCKFIISQNKNRSQNFHHRIYPDYKYLLTGIKMLEKSPDTKKEFHHYIHHTFHFRYMPLRRTMSLSIIFLPMSNNQYSMPSSPNISICQSIQWAWSTVLLQVSRGLRKKKLYYIHVCIA